MSFLTDNKGVTEPEYCFLNNSKLGFTFFTWGITN